MSRVDDARRRMQDFVAPEIRSISAQIESIREQMAASRWLRATVQQQSATRFYSISLRGFAGKFCLRLTWPSHSKKIEALQAKQQPSATQ